MPLALAVLTSGLLSACGGGGGTEGGAATESAQTTGGGSGTITGGADSTTPAGGAGGSGGGGSPGDAGGGSGSTDPLAESAPDAVSGLAAVVEDQSSIVLTWSNAARAARYDLYWSLSPGVDVQTANRIENVTSPFRQEGLLGGIAYHYVVRAINAAGVSAPSTEVSALLPPGAVSGFNVTSGDSAIALTWLETPHTSGYRIYWAQTLAALNNNAAMIAVNAPPFTHTGLQNGSTYHYVIAAVGAAGEGLLSSPVSAQAQTPLPTAPRQMGAQVNPDDSSSAILTWQAPETPVNPADILYYSVYRSTESGIAGKVSGVTKLTETSAGFFIDSVPVTGIPYYYLVTALTATGEGSPSAEVSVTPTSDGETRPGDDRDVADGVFECGEPLECWTRGSVTP